MLNEKIMLITGGGCGIGRACAVMAVKEHAKVFIIGRREEPLRETKKIITEMGGTCAYKVCDISKAEEAENIAKEVVKVFGKLDCVINNAAVFLTTDIQSEHLEESWQKMFDVNVMGMIRVIHGAIPFMKEAGGSIINLSSIDAFSGCKGYSGYSATKGAVISLTRALALELGEHNIRVNAVAPGITDTPMTHERILHGKEGYLQKLALKRIGRDEDIAGAVIFLTSDNSSFITGEVINVNGGMQFI